MENGSQASADPEDLPGRHLTVNQVVAWNMAYFRKAAGIGQAELGERLGGWDARKVSAAERSFESGRTREFDAHTLANLAIALGIPLLALFLPPDDDRVNERYLWHAHEHGADCSDMGDLVALAMPDTEEQSPAMDAYRQRLTDAVARYLDPSWVEAVEMWMSDVSTPEVRKERAARLREQRQVLLSLAADLGGLAGAIDPGEEA